MGTKETKLILFRPTLKYFGNVEDTKTVEDAHCHLVGKKMCSRLTND